MGKARTFCRLAPAAVAISALLAGSAFAQRVVNSRGEVVSAPVVLPNDYPNAHILKENPWSQRARENAYRRALKKIPDQKNTRPADPWQNMRSTAASPQSQQ